MAPKPSDHTCEWCGETAVAAFELKRGAKQMPTGRYTFACGGHVKTAQRVIAGMTEPRPRPI